MSRNERRGDRHGARHGGERGPAQKERHHQCASPIGAETAVAHDLKLARTVPPATEAVRRIGKAIFMQATGNEEGRAECKRSCKRRGQSDSGGNRVGQCTGATHERTGHRERPACARNVAAIDRRGMRDRQAGAEKNAGPEIGGKTTSPSIACLHRWLPVDHLSGVMAGLVPAIHVLLAPPPYPPPRAGEGREGEDVDARDKRGHDDES